MNKPRCTGLLLLGAGATGLGALLYASLVERWRIRLDRYQIEVDHPGLPPEGLTILHLSDLHFRPPDAIQDRKLRRLERLLAGTEYDLVAFTGDLVHNMRGFPAALEFLGGLHPRLGSFSCPGNHDYTESSIWGIFEDLPAQQRQAGWLSTANLLAIGRSLWRFANKVLHNQRVHHPVAIHDLPAMHEALAAIGVQPLVNSAAHIACAGANLWVAGLDDLSEGQPDPGAAFAGVPGDALVLLLAHHPDTWLDPLVAERADLVLSGHVHGGQVRLPLLGAVHTQGSHLPRRRAAGWFRHGRAWCFASQGAGESMPLRLGVPPQAALIRLQSMPHR
jgi:predicted MPP superfamily phosphohydrolase